jgi:hypothetical protein
MRLRAAAARNHRFGAAENPGQPFANKRLDFNRCEVVYQNPF